MIRKFFNIAGPCVPGDHYMLDPFRGIGGDLMYFIDSKQYFLISEETAQLYAQHTENTGQIFESEAIERVFNQTQGKAFVVVGC